MLGKLLDLNALPRFVGRIEIEDHLAVLFAVIGFAAAEPLRETAGEKDDGILQPLAGVDRHDLDLRRACIDRLDIRFAAAALLPPILQPVGQAEQIEVGGVPGLLDGGENRAQIGVPTLAGAIAQILEQ